MLALAAALLAASPTPPPLACLERDYGLRAVEVDGGWVGELPDGARVPYDDGRAHTADEAYAHPTLRDLWFDAYPRGAIAPVTTVDADPGRVRVDALFFAAYGHTAAEVEKQLVPFTFFGQRLRVHRKVLPAFQRVARRLRELVAREPKSKIYLENAGGTFNWRPIAGTDKLSAHSFGVSLDINVKKSAYWRWAKPVEPITWRNEIPQAIVDAFEAEGFIWGGRWYHYDTMHFEYRPELTDPACWP